MDKKIFYLKIFIVFLSVWGVVGYICDDSIRQNTQRITSLSNLIGGGDRLVIHNLTDTAYWHQLAPFSTEASMAYDWSRSNIDSINEKYARKDYIMLTVDDCPIVRFYPDLVQSLDNYNNDISLLKHSCEYEGKLNLVKSLFNKLYPYSFLFACILQLLIVFMEYKPE